MKLKIAIPLVILGSAHLVACQSNSVISEEIPEAARSEMEEQRARQLHDEYWQEQMERAEAIEEARQRARDREEMRRRNNDR